MNSRTPLAITALIALITLFGCQSQSAITKAGDTDQGDADCPRSARCQLSDDGAGHSDDGDDSGGDNGAGAPSHQLRLTLKGLPHSLPAEARVHATVYGYDRYIADVPATEMIRVEQAVPTDRALVLRFDEADFQGVEYQSGTTESLGYYPYLRVVVEGSGDGPRCTAEWVRDYDASPMTFYDHADRDVEADIHFKAGDDDCTPATPTPVGD